MKSIIILSALFLFISCKSEEVVVVETEVIEEQVVEESKPQRPYQVEARIGKFSKGDPVRINKAEIKGNTLFLEVSYSGGCGLHEFDFIGDPAIMKSLPPKRNVMLHHNANSDQCEEYVSQNIEVDITELSVTETAGSEIILILDGYKEPLTYIYE